MTPLLCYSLRYIYIYWRKEWIWEPFYSIGHSEGGSHYSLGCSVGGGIMSHPSPTAYTPCIMKVKWGWKEGIPSYLEKVGRCLCGGHKSRHVCTLTQSHYYDMTCSCDWTSGEAKLAKYGHLDWSHFFVPFTMKSFGVLGETAENFVGRLGDTSARSLVKPSAKSTLCSTAIIHTPS